MQPRKINKEHMRKFLEIMLRPEVGCMELCGLGSIIDYKTKMIIKANKHSMVVSGWYDNVEDIVRDVSRFNEASVYVTLNPVIRDLLAKSYCKLSRPEHRTKDEQIVCYSWIYIDIDPKRESDISSTNKELEYAIAKRDEILSTYPFIKKSSIWGKSGNGCWILVRVLDLPIISENADDIKLLLENLSNIHSNVHVEIDKGCKNPSRLMCLPGSVKCKGDDTPDRPWRLATIDSEDEPTETVNIKEWLKLFPIQEKIVAKPNPKKNVDEYKKVNRIKYFEKVIRDEIDLLLSTPHGLRNDQLNKSAGSLYKYVQAGGLNREEIDRELWRACREIGLDQDTNCDVESTLESAWKYGQSRLADLSTIRELNQGHDVEKKIDDASYIPDDPPEIILGNDYHRITMECILALRRDPNLYQRFGELVSVRSVPAKNVGESGSYNSYEIYKVDSNNIHDRLTQYARFKKYQKEDNELILVDAHLPSTFAERVISRNEWPGIRSLNGIVATPVLKPSGSLLNSKGYDYETWLIFRSDQEFPEIPESPTREDAIKSLHILFDLLSQFPFSKRPSEIVHKAAWLTALLTPLARYAINGPCPLFIFDGNARGVGKSLLCDIISCIVNGNKMPRTPYSSDEEEQRKSITSTVISGCSMSLFDDVQTSFGGPTIDAVLTGERWRDRILGVSQNTDDIPLSTVWYITGNNISLKGDIARRFVTCRLETNEEHPEKRNSDKFTYKMITNFAMKNNKMLVMNALTILRAYYAAGAPKQKIESLGSYESWSNVIRSAVSWITGVDPCAARDELVEGDIQSARQAMLIEAWQELPDYEYGLTCAQVLKLLKDETLRYRRDKYQNERIYPGGGSYIPEVVEPAYGLLREVLMGWSKNNELPNTNTLGSRLREMRNRVYSGRKLWSHKVHNTHVWYIIEAEKDSPDSLHRENTQDAPF